MACDSPEHSRLLALPAELQLSIYELAVVEVQPLLLNCPCDSSYHGHREQYDRDYEAWESGEKQPPQQPGLARTSRYLRDIVLPIFYKHNVFVARYCTGTQRELPFRWLAAVGPVNRQLLTHLYLRDDNPAYDSFMPHADKAKRRLARSFNSQTQTLDHEGHCCHRVTFQPVVDVDGDDLRTLFDGDDGASFGQTVEEA
ncbi:hypothetical protein Tdes44962_MAKER01822 [Teratosphaeria destructans]|uniref:F-box domain-containing protein n=1 Tax=Teratosphaeria destructans TaxID=418781 RepID=A0A9W7SX87_9PEZI|nr:hypothetical protein Tdes44962_MAKER01822 [Teratosphaeria destructans]